MKITAETVNVTAYVSLFEGEDYEKEQLVPDQFTGGSRKILEGTTLTEIAKKNGYERCTWSSHEDSGEINALFEKGKECKCNDAAGKSCNCSSKS